jgi:cytidyltransferase-like protein
VDPYFEKVVDLIRMRQKDWGHQFILASGYFDPIHRGHVRYLQACQERGFLVVVVNNDRQAALKKGSPFMPEDERLEIVRALRCVSYAVLAVDDDRSVSKTVELLRPDIFANGGDVTREEECREAATCRKLGIQMVFGVGGFDKVQSSSRLVERARSELATAV